MRSKRIIIYLRDDVENEAELIEDFEQQPRRQEWLRKVLLVGHQGLRETTGKSEQAE